jgi:hypothetical protein
MAKDKNDSGTSDLFGNEPMISALSAVSSKLKKSDTDANTVEFTLKGVTNVNDTAMLKTPVWAVAVGEWLCRICNDDFHKAQHEVMLQELTPEQQEREQSGGKGLDSTGLLSVKLKGAEVEAVFVCQSVMSDIMRLSDERISSMVARWLVSLCNGDATDAIAYVNDGYMRIANEQESAVVTTARVLRFK